MKKWMRAFAIICTVCMFAGASPAMAAGERLVWGYIENADYVQNFEPAPNIENRDFWQGLPDEVKTALVEDGEQYLDNEWSVIFARDYMEYSRTGDRNGYQNKQFSRRTALNSLVLAECVENEGRFLPDIIDGIFLIMEEGTWCIPAHNVYIRDTQEFPLPDYTRPVVDLFAGETAGSLAVAEYLLRPVLMETHEFIVTDINQRLNERIFEPYLSYHFWWMGDGVSHMLNWTPWITHNVMLAAFTRPDDVLPVETKQKILEQAAISTDFFLDEYEEDGCCDEGASYFSNAALTNFNCLDLMNQVTGGALEDIFTNTKIYNMGNYITRMNVADNYYFNFGDAGFTLGNRTAREYLYGKRTGSRELMDFAASDMQKNMQISGGQSLYFRLITLQYWDEIKNHEPSPTVREDSFFESQDLLVARDETFTMGVKGGNNGVAHNHNDVGSFIIYKDKQPMFIDLGVGTYTKQTFDINARYELYYMQSGYHNLPTLGGFVQQAGDGAGTGTEFAAKEVTHSIGDDATEIRMEISDAYRRPGEDIGIQIGEDDKLMPTEGASKIRSYYRTAKLIKGDKIVIEDEYDGDLPAVLSLMISQEPTIEKTDDGFLVQIGTLGTCTIYGASGVEAETIEMTENDPRGWGDRVYRLLVDMDDAHKLTLEIE